MAVTTATTRERNLCSATTSVAVASSAGVLDGLMPFTSLNTSVMNRVLLSGVSPFVVASHGASDWSPETPAAIALLDNLLSVRHASMF